MSVKLEDCYCCFIDEATGVSCPDQPEWWVEAEADGYLDSHTCSKHLPVLLGPGMNHVMALAEAI